MFLFGGNQKKQIKKINQTFQDKVKQTTKMKICQICMNSQSTQLAFGSGVTARFCCKNCELKAVGGVIQKLGDKNLIGNDKFAEILTNELINYQTNLNSPSVDFKKTGDSCEESIKKVKELNDLIKEELKKMKVVTKTKLQQISSESDKSNSIMIFEEVSKLLNEKKGISTDTSMEMIKRSLVNGKGLHFIDEPALENLNNIQNERINQVKKQTKTKLKDVRNLIDQINKIEL